MPPCYWTVWQRCIKQRGGQIELKILPEFHRVPAVKLLKLLFIEQTIPKWKKYLNCGMKSIPHVYKTKEEKQDISQNLSLGAHHLQCVMKRQLKWSNAAVRINYCLLLIKLQCDPLQAIGTCFLTARITLAFSSCWIVQNKKRIDCQIAKLYLECLIYPSIYLITCPRGIFSYKHHN